MNTIKFIVIVSIVLLGSNLVYHQVVNGYIFDIPQAYKESKVILRYCYDHADRPNPVQDLNDKGILTPGWFVDETCITVKQWHDAFPTNYREEIRPYCHDGLKEDLGHEPSELAINNCVEDAVKSLGE